MADLTDEQLALVRDEIGDAEPPTDDEHPYRVPVTVESSSEDIVEHLLASGICD